MDEDKVVRELVWLREQVGLMATREDLSRLENRIMDAFDKQTVILQRLDQERVFTDGRIGRIEEDVESIKLKLRTV